MVESTAFSQKSPLLFREVMFRYFRTNIVLFMKGYFHTHTHSAHSVCFCFEAVSTTTSSTDYLLEFLSGCQGWFLIEFATKRYWHGPAQEARKLLRGAKKTKLFSNTSFKTTSIEFCQYEINSTACFCYPEQIYDSGNVCPSHGPLI